MDIFKYGIKKKFCRNEYNVAHLNDLALELYKESPSFYVERLLFLGENDTQKTHHITIVCLTVVTHVLISFNADKSHLASFTQLNNGKMYFHCNARTRTQVHFYEFSLHELFTHAISKFKLAITSHSYFIS